jgi:SM-20-related protein
MSNKMVQISNQIFCKEFLTELDIKTGILPNPYYDLPFLIIENFLSSKVCEDITSSMRDNQDICEAEIRKHEAIKIETGKDTTIRKTNIHKLSSFHENIYNDSFEKHQEDIQKFFNLSITTSTEIQALEYTKGSFYKQHSDDSSVLLKDNEVVGFLPVALERKITTVLFTTNHSDILSKNNFNGGELIFNYLYDREGKKIQIKPKAGDMIVFFSNPYFTHEVLEVKKGYRVSLVQWHDAIIH